MGAALVPLLTAAVGAGATAYTAERGRKSNERIAKKNQELQEASQAAEFRKSEEAKRRQRTASRIERFTVQRNLDDAISSRGIRPTRSSLSQALLGGSIYT